MEKLDLVGLAGDENKFPGEISGGMKKRAGLARFRWCWTWSFSATSRTPVWTGSYRYLSQLLIDINAQIGATVLIVTHNINIARTVPDNMGMLFRKHLVMFGPREVLLTSGGRRQAVPQRPPDRAPSACRGEGRVADGRGQAMLDAGHHDGGVDEIEACHRS